MTALLEYLNLFATRHWPESVGEGRRGYGPNPYLYLGLNRQVNSA